MANIEQYKNKRFGIKEHLSIPISQERSKFDVSDREISGYAIVWDSKNDYGEIVLKGATLKSLNARGVNSNAGNKIQFLLQHDKTKILGQITDLYEDDYGLFFRASISEGIAHCEESLIQIREGLLKQLSYGFNYVWTDEAIKYDKERDAYILKEIILHEISLVTFSSDPNAQLRDYNTNQFMLRMSTFSNSDLNKIMDALSIISIADEATKEECAGITNNIKKKF